ncbi:MAG TPA: fluoride efflux transporter CrcB [Acidisarcina sp.]
MRYLWVALGGALGAVARYALGVWFYDRWGGRIPYGTFVINVSGSFAIGLIVAVLDARTSLPVAWRYAVPIGFIGAYTTFSTFELDTIRAVQEGRTGVAILNVVLSVVLGYGAVWLGLIAGRQIA